MLVPRLVFDLLRAFEPVFEADLPEDLADEALLLFLEPPVEDPPAEELPPFELEPAAEEEEPPAEEPDELLPPLELEPVAEDEPAEEPAEKLPPLELELPPADEPPADELPPLELLAAEDDPADGPEADEPDSLLLEPPLELLLLPPAEEEPCEELPPLELDTAVLELPAPLEPAPDGWENAEEVPPALLPPPLEPLAPLDLLEWLLLLIVAGEYRQSRTEKFETLEST